MEAYVSACSSTGLAQAQIPGLLLLEGTLQADPSRQLQGRRVQSIGHSCECRHIYTYIHVYIVYTIECMCSQNSIVDEDKEVFIIRM